MATDLCFASIPSFFLPMPKNSRPSTESSRRSSCPIACSLDLLGDRWSLLIIRDLLRGMTRYGEFLGGPEKITTNILADRLERLEKAGLITSTPYQQNPPRYAYTLTSKGAELKSVLGALASWSIKHLPRVQPDKLLAAALRS
jgi:DNA-binding HxlR family transcriptional regulator